MCMSLYKVLRRMLREALINDDFRMLPWKASSRRSKEYQAIQEYLIRMSLRQAEGEIDHKSVFPQCSLG